MATLDLKVVNQFLVVAEELSFRKAAERLHMSQPPLSVSIKQLEDYLGFPLFNRQSTGVTLTAAGKVFRSEGEKLLQSASHAVQVAGDVAFGRTGTLRIAFVSSAIIDVLPRVMIRFRDLHPGVELKLSEAVSLEGLRLVEKGLVDIAFVSPPLDLPDSILSENVSIDSVSVVLHHAHSLASESTLALSDLAKQDFVSFSQERNPGLSRRMVASCLSAGFEPRIVQEATQLHTLLALVSAGLGIALLPSTLAKVTYGGVVFKAIDPQIALLETRIDAIYRAAEAVPLLASFLGVVRAEKTFCKRGFQCGGGAR